MADVTGYQIIAPVDGGPANKGQDVAFKLKVNNGEKDFDLTLFVEHDKLPLLISHLITYGGMARNTRLGQNPMEEADGTYASAHALGLANVITSRSLTDPDYAILTLQFDAGQRDSGEDRRLNLYCAANKAELNKLRTACDVAIGLLQTDIPEFSRH